MQSDSVLLVEGQDDKHIITNLLFSAGLKASFNVKDKDGLDNLLTSFPVEIRASGLKRLAVVIDADVSLISRWDRIASLLTKAGYTGITRTPAPEGTIVTTQRLPAIGIWLMPNNLVDGMIEDFAALLVPADDTLMPKARAAVGLIPDNERLFAPVHHSKAVIHTWLAWQQEPGVRMGAAITRRYLDAASTTADTFLDWLRRFLTS